MQDILFTACAMFVVALSAAQPLCLLVSLWRIPRHETGGQGPYRASDDEAKIRSLQEELERLRADARTVPRPERLQAAGSLSLAAMSGAVVTALCLMQGPTPTAPHTLREPTMRITTSHTSGGEWQWQCRQDRHILIAVAPNVLQPRCHIAHDPLETPIFVHVDANAVGDRAWMLWFYPDRPPPDTMSYVLN